MDTIIYIWMVLIIQLVLITYYGLNNFSNLIFKSNTEKQLIFQDHLSKISFNNISFFNTKKDNPKLNSSNQDIEEELKKCKGQLRRNLMTLNYMNLLELNSESNKYQESIIEELTLRKSLQLEVIRNSKLVKHYSTLLV